MSSFELSWNELKQRTYFGRPHVVILGAGASLAAFPKGDRFGSVLPLMNNLTEVLELAQPLQDQGFQPDRNFEDIYSELVAIPDLVTLRELVEERTTDSNWRRDLHPRIIVGTAFSLKTLIFGGHCVPGGAYSHLGRPAGRR